MAPWDLGGKGEILSQVFWYNSTISLPLDTISVFLSDYGNTTLTSSSTIYGNITSLSASIDDQVAEAQEHFSQLADGAYEDFAPYVLANGTNGVVPGGMTSFAYPTPYIAIAGFSLLTNVPYTTCLRATCIRTISCALDASTIFGSLMAQGPDNPPDGVGIATIQLKSTFYAPLPISAADGFFGFFDLDVKSFSAFLKSNTSLWSDMPYLSSCSYPSSGIGPPALQIPATALTNTMKTTIKETSPYLRNTPAPGSPIRPSVPPQTMTVPYESTQGSPAHSSPNQGPPSHEPPLQGPSIHGTPAQGSSNQGSPGLDKDPPGPTQGSPDQGALSIGPADNSNLQKGVLPATEQPSQQGVSSKNPTDQAAGPLDNIPGSVHQGDPSRVSGIPQEVSPARTTTALAIVYLGTTIQPNEASEYILSGIGTVSPGGPGVMKNGIVYSLAPSATALLSNGIAIPITPKANEAAASPRPGVLPFRGATYTADSFSRFIIAGETLTPAGPAITVSGTPIKIAPGATAAIIGSESVPIVRSPALPRATGAPILTFAGLTYTAGISSAFVIEGQTLAPGANIEVQGTQISYRSDGSEIVVGTSTEQLSFASITPSVTAPVLTFHGSTYTADSLSQFIIDGQTLVPGKVLTVSGTPISYAAAGTAVVIGTSTEPLSYAKLTPSAPTISFDGTIYNADASSDFVVDGQTLTPGGIITVSGTPISYPAAGTAVMIGDSTGRFSDAKMTQAAPAITFDGSTYTADASSDFIINGQTLAPGGIITVSGTPISYASGGGDVAIGTSTEPVGIGGLIMSGIGGAPVDPSVTVFTGGTVQERTWSCVLLGATVVLLFCSALW